MMKITERGWAGHFILGDRCLFRRNTLIENGDRRIVVSTVGCLRKEYNGKYTYDTIGAGGRTYETMAFEAIFEDGYWEADIEKGLSFDSNWQLKGFHRLSDAAANRMHENVVSELSGVIDDQD